MRDAVIDQGASDGGEHHSFKYTHGEYHQQEVKTRRAFRLSWVLLAGEEHEQKDNNAFQLLVAQRQGNGQFQHGKSLVYAGRPANWLMVGSGGYEEPSGVIRSDSLPPTVAGRYRYRGLPARRGGLPRRGVGSQFMKHN